MNKRIVRIDQFEFETDDGSVYQHPEQLDVVPSVEEFQKSMITGRLLSKMKKTNIKSNVNS